MSVGLTDDDMRECTRIAEIFDMLEADVLNIYARGLAAGRARTIEECITACDREREIYQLGPPGSLQNDAQQMARSACWGCAAAIRALLNAQPACSTES